MTPELLAVVEGVASAPGRPIRDVIVQLLSNVAKAISPTFHLGPDSQSQEVEMEDDDGSDHEYDAFDEFEDYEAGTTRNEPKLRLAALQS